MKRASVSEVQLPFPISSGWAFTAESRKAYMQPITVFIKKENPFITHNDLKQIRQSPRGTRCHMIPQPKSFINVIDQ